MFRWIAVFVGLAMLALGTAYARPSEWIWNLPPGIEPPAVPSGNSMSAAKVELGRRLFYDADLSVDGTMSCATCHSQKRAFADGNRSRPGVHGDPGKFNVPGLANIAYFTPLTWANPRLETLEEQALVPIFGDQPVEMGMKGLEAELLRRLSDDQCYISMFRKAFPDRREAVAIVSVAEALTAFQRSLISYGSAYDRHRRDGERQLSQTERQGQKLFNARCASCHSGDNFSDGRFHVIERLSAGQGAGLAEITGRHADRGRYRTPGLRNAVLTAPYLHDGSAATLEDAILRHSILFRNGQEPTVQELASLRQFLNMLTDEDFISDPRFAHPEEACGKPL